MAVTQVVAGLAKTDGGPAYSVPALTGALREAGVEAVLRSVARGREQPASPPGGGSFRSHYPWDEGLVRLMRGSSELRTALEEDVRSGSILHAHGLWLLPNLYPAWIKRQIPATGLVHSPRGMLAPAALEISKWKKRSVWHVWQKAALQAADCLHATAESEYDEIRAAGLRNPVAVIPNGIDLPPPRQKIQGVVSQKRTILSLGRIHPKKALDNLVRAWAMVEAKYPAWSVSIIGPAELGYDEQLRRLCVSLDVERLAIGEPVYGAEKHALYQDSELFVLPTRNENFGMVVAEALAAGIPVISTKGAPWQGLEEQHCGWWIDFGVEPLAKALINAIEMDAGELAAMGQRGRAWMMRDFGWERVAAEMRSVYEWLRLGPPAPRTVRIE
jgi:glycosyltransferase involved in cell wall biosynthesis